MRGQKMREEKLRMFLAMVCFFLTLLAGPGMVLAAKTLKVGVLGPFTGPAAETGAEFKGSVEMALDRVGNKIGEYKIEIVWIDSQSDPAKATNAYAEAVERKGIECAMLNWHSSVSVAVMDLAAQYKIPHIFPIGATEVVNQKWRSDPEKYSYWGGKGWPIPGKLIAGYAETIDYVVKNGKFNPKDKVAAIACEDTDWGHSAGDSLAADIRKKGWEVAAVDYFPITQTDFYPLLGKYKKKGVSVLFSTSTAAPVTSAFIKQTREVGLKSLVIIDGLGWSGDWYKMAGPDSDGVLDMIPQLTTTAAKTWAEEFEKRYGMKPSPSTGGLSYDGAGFFIKALQRVNEKYGQINKETIHKIMVEEINTGKLTYSKADGAIIMNEYRYNMETMPDPVVGRDAYFFPVIQYKGGIGSIVYPEDWAEAEFTVPDQVKNK